jgi:uncharacterized protein
MRIEQLYRYPVKGLSAEALDEAVVEPGGTLPWDRAFALAQGDAPFDPTAPTWLQKGHFMCLMRNARIAGLRAGFDLASGLLTVRAPDGAMAIEPVLEADGRARIAAFLTAFLGEEARGTPQFHYVPGHVFGDHHRPAITLFNLTSLAAFEAAVGAPRDRMRFRANIYFTGPAWSEFAWVGQTITVGGIRLRVTKRTARCPATEVNPVTGERDANPVAELRTAFGHTDLGVHAEVIEGGRLAVGNAIRLDAESVLA